jgi:hypothetical protein
VFTDGYFYDYDKYYTQGNAAATETPKPVIDVVRSVYSPIKVSIENFNNKIYAGSWLDFKCYAMNDDPAVAVISAPTLYVDLLNPSRQSVWSDSYQLNDIEYYDTVIQPVSIETTGLPTANYTISVRLNDGSEDLYTGEKQVFIADANWANVGAVAAAIGVYDASGDTFAMLSSLGFNTTQISSFTSISGYDLVVIGKTSFDATVVSSEADILSYITSGGRVLVLEQNTTETRDNLSTSSWLESSITVNTGGENFVNIERPEISSLMDGLTRNDFRKWNNIGTESDPVSRLFYSYLELDYSDLDNCVVLANAGQQLYKAVLTEIYPAGSGAGSCLINTVYSVSEGDNNPIAKKYLANLVNYMLDNSQMHSKYATVGAQIDFADFETEKGLFYAPMLQGLLITNNDPNFTAGSTQYTSSRPRGRQMRGEHIHTGGGYLENIDSQSSWVCPLHFQSIYDIEEIVMEVTNPKDTSLSYRIIVNGDAQSWVSVDAESYKVSTFDIADISEGSGITLEIEADKGLVFDTMQLAEHNPADINRDDVVDLADFAKLAENWFKTLADVWQN